MTSSELILSKIAARLAIIVTLGLLGHLPDQRHQRPLAQANAIEISEASPPASRLENRTHETVGYAD
jgi:hypothetical protein